MADEFYIGYRAEAPAGLSRFLKGVSLGLLLLAAGVAAVLTTAQKPFDPGTFEFGIVRDLEGTIRLRPVPLLVVERPGSAESSAYLLVAPGKHGAEPLVAAHDGRTVRLRGSLIHTADLTMVELEPDSIEPLGRPAGDARLPGRDLGTVTLVGEIVDSKCFLGVMKPGREKPHRACATLCIRGGIPPLLRATDSAGRSLEALLVGSGGEALNRDLLDRVAVPVEVTGRLRRLGDLLILAADAGSIVTLE